MNDNTLKQSILRDLVTQWKLATSDKPKIFEKILVRIDKLIIYKIGKIKRQYEKLELEDNDALYNTAIVGVYRALDSAKDEDTGARIQARILSYIKEEIRKTYLQHKTEIITGTLTGNERDLPGEEPEFSSIEFEELKEIVNKLIENFTLPKEDFEIFVEHFVGGKSYKQIAEPLNIHFTTVASRIRNVKRILKEAMEGQSEQV